MEEKRKFQLPERNPATHAVHRREVFWQITFPLIIVLTIILGLTGGVIYAGVIGLGEVSRWADVSLIWLLLPALVVALLMLLMLVGMVMLVAKLLGVLPGYARLVQDFVNLLRNRVKLISEKSVEPLLRLHSLKAEWDTLRRRR